MKVLCRNPFVKGDRAYGCGQCTPCRVNRRRIWVHRIMLESTQHMSNCFVTLTYDDEHIPEGGSLAKKDFQDWLKRLRRAVEPTRIRYFGVGEYGDVSQRPHYHLALFGYGGCESGRTRHNSRRPTCCGVCDTIRDTWGRGNVYVGDLETQSAQYIAGYVVKKLTNPKDERLKGREPEFGLMSRHPAIGTDALYEVASVLLRYDLDEQLPDVPDALRWGGQELPLGRTLRGKLRDFTGMEKPETFPEKPEVQAVYDAAKDVPTTAGFRETYIKNALMDLGEQRALQQSARLKIMKGRKVL